MVVEIELTTQQQKVMHALCRVGGSVSICCSLYMMISILKSQYYRSRIYSRLVFGNAISIVLLSITNLWGSAAVPQDTDYIHGANGTVATCSASGFLWYFSLLSVGNCFVAQALVAFLSIRYYKQRSNVLERAEPWIHVGIYIFPLGSAIYLLAKDAYNPFSAKCAVAGIPLGCGTEENIECTRGPQNIRQLQWMLVNAPMLFIHIVPFILMVRLYLWVRKETTRPNARRVAAPILKQTLLYLLVVWWTFLFRFIHAGMLFVGDVFSYWIWLVAGINEAFVGLWFLIFHTLVRSNDPTKGLRRSISLSPDPKSSKFSLDEGGGNSTDEGGNGSASLKGSSIFQSSKAFKPRFSIFDGSAIPVDSPWAAFLTEGTDQAYLEDAGEYDDSDYNN